MKKYQRLFVAIGLVAVACGVFAVWYHTQFPGSPLQWTFGGVVFVGDRIESPPPFGIESVDGRALRGFTLPRNSTESLQIVLPPQSALDLTLRAKSGDRGRFEVIVARPGEDQALVFFRDLGEIPSWRRERVWMRAYEGPVELTFRFHSSQPDAAVFVGDPRLTVPEARLRRRVVLVSCDGFDSRDSDFPDERGFLYEHGWPAASDPVASWASMLTGLYTPQHRVGFSRTARLPSGFLTIPELAGKEGWTTACFVSGVELEPDASLFQGFGEASVYARSESAVVDALDWLDRYGDSPSLVALLSSRTEEDPDPWSQARSVVERVLAGELGQTLVVVMGVRGSDSGEAMPPLWIAGAGLKGGGRTDEPVHQVGVFATVCHTLSINPPRDLEGDTLLAPFGKYDVRAMRLLYEVEEGRLLDEEGAADADPELREWLAQQSQRFAGLFTDRD